MKQPNDELPERRITDRQTNRTMNKNQTEPRTFYFHTFKHSHIQSQNH